MATMRRAALKAFTWQATGFVTMSLLGYLMTGSWRSAGGLAFGSAAIGFAMYILHEKLWSLVPPGLAGPRHDTGPVGRDRRPLAGPPADGTQPGLLRPARCPGCPVARRFS